MSSEEPSIKEQLTFTSGSQSGPPDLRLIHFNDVYHVEAGSCEPVGGITRFTTLVKQYAHDEKYKDQPELITLFSGDAFNPSLESTVTKGSHMVPVLNSLNVACACVGNHDLDFGVPQFQHLAKQCDFPWLLANVLDPALGDNVALGGVPKTLLLTASNGIKVGLIGLVEREWLETINVLPPNLIYKSASATAKELVPGLREQGADMIIAITHQREPNDNKLAEKCEGMIDMILGGHDHFYGHSIINGTHVLRSGSDFKQLSYIEAWKDPTKPQKWLLKIIKRDVVADIPVDQAAAQLIDSVTSALRSKLQQPIGYTATPLDARFTTVRLKESNLGNFVCDMMRIYYNADCCIAAGGTFRGDVVYPKGLIRLGDIMNCFPFEDPVVVLRLSGQAVREALENAVGKYPALEGRFPQVSNIEFEFDASKPEGERISYVKVGGEPIDLGKKYTLATRDYMARGKDGFTSLLPIEKGGPAEVLVSEENGMLISTILRQYFLSLKVMRLWRALGNGVQQHWQNVKDDLHNVHPVKNPAEATTKSPAQESKTMEDPDLEPAEDSGYSSGRTTTNDSFELSDSDQDSDSPDHPHSRTHAKHRAKPATKVLRTVDERREKRMMLKRKYVRKWLKKAGLHGKATLADDEGDELDAEKADWTLGIAPQLEGRVKILNGED